MTYPNYTMAQQNPYYSMPHPNYFTNTMNQNYGNPTTQQQMQQTQTTTNQSNITQQNNGSKITPVSNKEEATGATVDLIYGTPSFFYNKSNGEIYLKQFDVQNGTAIFKIYGEIQPIEENNIEQKDDYKKELHYISEGIDNLHRMIAQMQYEKRNSEVVDIEPDEVIITKPKGKKRA